MNIFNRTNKFWILTAAFLMFITLLPLQVFACPVSSGEAVLEVETGRVLYSHYADKKLSPASTTKILTAIIIIEDCDLDVIIKVPASAANVEGSSIYLVEGETLTIRDLLYGLMLRSGNDCATALALHHSGTINKFAKVMNKKAKEIGAESSHFMNPHGLPVKDHYTTAHDLGMIAAYAMRNETFAQIVKTKFWTIPDGGCGYTRNLINKNKMLTQYDGADGVKTGFTKEAGRCLVSSATRNNMHLVSVVLNSPSMYERSGEILDVAFSKYEMVDVFDYSYQNISLPTDVKGKYCFCSCEGKCFYPLTEQEKSMVHIEADIPKIVKLPVHKGDVVGEIRIYHENQLIFLRKIVSIKDTEKSYLNILREILSLL